MLTTMPRPSVEDDVPGRGEAIFSVAESVSVSLPVSRVLAAVCSWVTPGIVRTAWVFGAPVSLPVMRRRTVYTTSPGPSGSEVVR